MDINNLTVIVPTKNEEKNVVSFLRSLPEEVNLLLIDSSIDRTHERVKEIRPQNTRIIKKDCNIPEARQTGTEAVQTEWLLFSDADIIFHQHYFKNLEEYQLIWLLKRTSCNRLAVLTYH